MSPSTNPTVHSDIQPSFSKSVQDFVKKVYEIGQAMLLHRNDLPLKDDSGVGSSTGSMCSGGVLDVAELLIQSNVVCIELLLWAMQEESGGYEMH